MRIKEGMKLKQNMYYDQCISFLARMIEKYGGNISLPEPGSAEMIERMVKYDPRLKRLWVYQKTMGLKFIKKPTGELGKRR